MRKEKIITLGDKSLTARELTVKQITQITEAFDGDGQKVSNIDMLFPDRLPSVALEMSLGLTGKQLSEYSPSEIELMLDAVEAVNPTFASLMQRLARIGREALAARTSAEPPAGSS